MANPVRPIGRSGFHENFDPENEGRRQDRERREREDEEFFQRTGAHRTPIPEYSPLVDQDSVQYDVADDGDSYIEDNPSEVHDNDDNDDDAIDSTVETIVNESGEIAYTVTDRRRNLPVTAAYDLRGISPNEARRVNIHQTYVMKQKEKQEEDKEFEKLVEESKNKIGNAIEGLDE